MNAGYVPGIVNMGIVFELMENNKKAEFYYRNAIKRDKTYEIAHYKLGKLLLRTNKMLEGLKEFKQALNYNPDFSPAYNELGVVALENGKYELALESLKKAVELDSTYATAYYNLGGVLENMGKYNDAANAYNNYLKFADTPQDSQNVLIKIQILKTAGKYR